MYPDLAAFVDELEKLGAPGGTGPGLSVLRVARRTPANLLHQIEALARELSRTPANDRARAIEALAREF